MAGADGDGEWLSQPFGVTVLPDLLSVASVEAETSGFHVRFDRAIDQQAINLYHSHDSGRGEGDVRVTDANGAAITGSIFFDHDEQGFRFVRTGGALPVGEYRVTLRGGDGGFADLGRVALDGNQDGVAGDDFVGSFALKDRAPVVFSLPDFMRGAGQSVLVPHAAGRGAGLPLTLSDGAGISGFDLILEYDRQLLSISKVEFAAGFSGRLSVEPLEGGLRILAEFDAALPEGAVSPLVLIANVPSRVPYGASHTIDLQVRDVYRGNETAVEAEGDTAVHLAAFFGDSSGNGAYTLLDVQRDQRVLTGRDTGFGAYLNIDPIIVADLNGNGVLNSLDVNRFQSFVLGSPRPEIPPLPDGAAPLTFDTDDVRIAAIGADVGGLPGSTVTVPLSIERAEGLESVRARITFDANLLQFVQVKPALTAGFEWRSVRTTTNADGFQTLEIDMAKLTPLAAGAGTLLNLEFRIRDGARRGTTSIDLQYLALDDTHVAQKVVSVSGEDPTDGTVFIDGEPLPAAPAIVAATTPRAMPRAPAPPRALSADAMLATAQAMSQASGGVNWSGQFAPAAPAPSAPLAVAPPAAAQWKSDAWAKDLSSRLTQMDTGDSADGRNTRSGLLRQLMRGIARTLGS